MKLGGVTKIVPCGLKPFGGSLINLLLLKVIGWFANMFSEDYNIQSMFFKCKDIKQLYKPAEENNIILISMVTFFTDPALLFLLLIFL